jgi:hypothetical protein
MVLGGNDPRWNSYPYDLPNLFVFTLTLAASLGFRWWMLLAFALACYSKETAVLLIAAHAYIHRDKRGQARYWLELLAMVGLYAGIRWWVMQRFDVPPTDEWWFPERNLRVLAWSIVSIWWTIPALIILVRIVRQRAEFPAHSLALLAGLAAVMVGAAFFKGWIEERRQYLELLPLAWLIFLRWATVEIGQPEWFGARPLDANQST